MQAMYLFRPQPCALLSVESEKLALVFSPTLFTGHLGLDCRSTVDSATRESARDVFGSIDVSINQSIYLSIYLSMCTNM